MRWPRAKGRGNVGQSHIGKTGQKLCDDVRVSSALFYKQSRNHTFKGRLGICFFKKAIFLRSMLRCDAQKSAQIKETCVNVIVRLNSWLHDDWMMMYNCMRCLCNLMCNCELFFL